MKPKDFAKYRLAALPAPTLFGIGYNLDANDLLSLFPLEDRPTVEEAQRLRDEFAKSFPSLEAELQKLRAHALHGRKTK